MSKYLKQLFIYLSYTIGVFPILTFRIRSIVTILWAVLGVYLYFKHSVTRKLNKEIFLFLTPFFLLVVSLFYSTNLKFGFDLLLKMISFIIYPLIIYLNKDVFSKKVILNIFYSFLIAVLVLVAYQYFQVLSNFDFLFGEITLKELKANGFSSILDVRQDKVEQIKVRRFRNFIIEITDTHPTYQGLWISFIIFFLGVKSYKPKLNKFLFLNLAAIFFLSFWFYLISPRMPFLALFISGIATIFIFSSLPKNRKILISIAIPVLLILLMFFKNPLSTRFYEYYKTGVSVLQKDTNHSEFNSSNVRNGIYYCDFKIVSNNVLLGVGVGDIQDELNKCYSSNLSSEIYEWRTYNTHNQYLFFWISSGILGLFTFLFLIYRIFERALKKKNIQLFFLMSLVAIVFLTENILERSDGLIFFSFFMSLLFFKEDKK